MTTVHLHARHRLHLLQGADELFAAVVHAIDRSHTEVRLETYIYAFDRQGEALALADRAAVLVEGRERVVAPCAELLADERMAALYLGRHAGQARPTSTTQEPV